MKFPIPKDLTEVTQENHIDFVATKILGWTTNDVGLWWCKDGEPIVKRLLSSSNESFNPFARIQDTKLCNKFLDDNNIFYHINKSPGKEWVVIAWNDNLMVSGIAKTEEMARMCAILMAANKLMEEK